MAEVTDGLTPNAQNYLEQWGRTNKIHPEDLMRIMRSLPEYSEAVDVEAIERAELMIKRAQYEARILVSSHEVTRQAQLEGQRIVEQAKQEGEAIRQGALEYARAVMENLNQAVTNLTEHTQRLQEVTRNARDEIKV